MTFIKLSPEDLEAGKSPKGGFTKAQLSRWGVEYPPKTGWKQALLEGRDPNNPDCDPDVVTDGEMLRRVVLAVIEAGQAEILHHVPGLLDRFGARLPSAEELRAHQATLRRDPGPWDDEDIADTGCFPKAMMGVR